MAEYVYGISKIDGRIVSIYDIPNEQVGLKCACKCPTCQRDFEACSLNGSVSRYFRHSSDKKLGVGGVGVCDAYSTNESALHLMAKEIIKEEQTLLVPPKYISVLSAGINYLPRFILENISQEYEYQGAENLKCSSVELEKQLTGFRPDVWLDTSCGEVLIEIVVTNKIKNIKSEKIEKYNAPVLKIDLSSFVESPVSRNRLREIIVEKVDFKSWIYYPVSGEALKTARKYYENLSVVQEYLEDKEKKRKEQLVEAERRARGEKKLPQLLEPQNYNAELLRLRNDEAFLKYANQELVFFKKYKKKPFFIDIPITGEMVFQCDRRIWQGQIFDRFIYKRNKKDAKFSVSNIFDKLKYDHKIPIDDDLVCVLGIKDSFKDVFCLSKDVVKTYIKYLEMLGFIASERSKFGYNQSDWKIVKASQTIIPPENDASTYFLNALKKVNRRSPNIDVLLAREMSEFYREKALKKEISQKIASIVNQETKKRKEEQQQAIQNFDYDQSKCYIRDENGYRLAKCTICGKILHARQVDIVPPNMNKGVCLHCARKKTNK